LVIFGYFWLFLVFFGYFGYFRYFEIKQKITKVPFFYRHPVVYAHFRRPCIFSDPFWF
jgi:hypothetical protein